MQYFLFLALIITMALVIFAMQNLTDVTISFFFWRFSGPLAFVLAITFASGILTGILLSVPTLLRRSRERRLQKKRLHELEEELSRKKLEGTEQQE